MTLSPASDSAGLFQHIPRWLVKLFEMRSSHRSPQGAVLIISSSRAGGFNLDNYRVKWPRLYSGPISPLTSEVAAAASRLNRHDAGSPFILPVEVGCADRQGQAGPGQIKSYKTRLDWIRPCQGKKNQIRTKENKPGKAKTDLIPDIRPAQTRPEQMT